MNKLEKLVIVARSLFILLTAAAVAACVGMLIFRENLSVPAFLTVAVTAYAGIGVITTWKSIRRI